MTNYFLFFEHYYQYNIYVNIYISLNRTTVPSHCMSFTYLRYTGLYFDQYNVVVTYYHTIVYVTGKHCIVATNKYKGEFHLIIYFKCAVVFIVSSTAGSS